MTTVDEPLSVPVGLIPYVTCEADDTRGSITVTGTYIPDGLMALYRRTETTSWEPVRGTAGQSGGDGSPIITGGFVREDPEAPLGQPVTYRMILTAASASLPLNAQDRFIMRNNVMTPDFTHGAGSWVPGTGRTLTIPTELGRKFGRISDTAATPGTTAARTIGTVKASKVYAKRAYRITARARYTTPNINLWVDVRDNPHRTWTQVKSEFPNWGSIVGGTSGQDNYASMYVGVVNPTGGAFLVSPVKVLDLKTNQQKSWFSFSLDITVPTGTPSTVNLAFLHGTQTREYAATWDLDNIGMEDLGYVNENTPYWFSGDTPTPPDPVEIKWPGTNLEAYVHDADIIWEGAGAGTTGGTPGNSTSLFYGPTRWYADVVCELGIPEGAVDQLFRCSPVFINDPVMPPLGEWFGLISISDLQYNARQSVYSILHRSPQVVISDVRNWATGTMTLMTSTLEQRKLALSVFNSGRILQFRNLDPSMPEGGFDGAWYLAVGTVTESRPFEDHRKPERFWELPFVKVEKPVGLIAASTQVGQTWAQVKSKFPSWGFVLRGNESWMEVRVGDEPIQPDNLAFDATQLPTLPAWTAWSETVLPVPP